VAPTFKPCTKGIWIWSEPLIINNKHYPYNFPCFLKFWSCNPRKGNRNSWLSNSWQHIRE